MNVKLITLFVAASLGAQVSLPVREHTAAYREPLYLPSGNALELISFGYRNALSNYLWMQAVSYFGQHYRSDKQYRWFAHQCDLVTRLNPKSFEPFYMCSSLLAWEANDPRAAITVLNRAVESHPDTWLFFYFRGFYRMYFEGDHRGAKQDFIAASQKPDANPIAARLASKSMAELQSPEGAIDFLRSTIASTKDPTSRAALERRLAELIYERDLDAIDAALALGPSTSLTLADLQRLGLYRGPVRDPFGGTYEVREGRAASTSNRKRISQYRGLKKSEGGT